MQKFVSQMAIAYQDQHIISGIWSLWVGSWMKNNGKLYLERPNILSQVLIGLESVTVVLERDVPRVVVRELDVNRLQAVLIREKRLKEDCFR